VMRGIRDQQVRPSLVICLEPLCGPRPFLCLPSSMWLLWMTDKGRLGTTLFQKNNNQAS
jgi:hypothetical protein